MIVTKEYLNKMIMEETQVVLLERELKHFLEFELLPYINENKKLLNEQELALLEEGMRDLLASVKGAASKGWKGIKQLFLTTINVLKMLPTSMAGTITATSALGWVLTNEPEGKEFVSNVMAVVEQAMTASTDGTVKAMNLLNVGADLLRHLGMDPGRFSPQKAIAKTNELLMNADSVVETFMLIPSDYFEAYGWAGLGSLILIQIIKATYMKIKASVKKTSAKKPALKVAEQPKASPEAKKTSLRDQLASLKATRA